MYTFSRRSRRPRGWVTHGRVCSPWNGICSPCWAAMKWRRCGGAYRDSGSMWTNMLVNCNDTLWIRERSEAVAGRYWGRPRRGKGEPGGVPEVLGAKAWGTPLSGPQAGQECQEPHLTAIRATRLQRLVPLGYRESWLSRLSVGLSVTRNVHKTTFEAAIHFYWRWWWLPCTESVVSESEVLK